MPARVILKCDKCGKEFRFQCNLHDAITIANDKHWYPSEFCDEILCPKCHHEWLVSTLADPNEPGLKEFKEE